MEKSCELVLRLRSGRQSRGDALAKVYVIVFYRSPPETSFAEYGELAIPAVHAGGGRILARGLPSKIYEAGMNERVTLIEFDSLDHAIATREGAAYQAAFAKLGNVVRDVRIIEAA
jgi:uncharacterized protein (DUF1330 family)